MLRIMSQVVETMHKWSSMVFGCCQSVWIQHSSTLANNFLASFKGMSPSIIVIRKHRMVSLRIIIFGWDWSPFMAKPAMSINALIEPTLHLRAHEFAQIIQKFDYVDMETHHFRGRPSGKYYTSTPVAAWPFEFDSSVHPCSGLQLYCAMKSWIMTLATPWRKTWVLYTVCCGNRASTLHAHSEQCLILRLCLKHVILTVLL